MVGVPGKYKGCETCRLRRVKCDNLRPYCKKCEDSGRKCAGYERKTVFIVGTPEDGGRCSSHPPRVVKSKRSPRSTASPGASASSSPSASSSAFTSATTSSYSSSSTLEPPPSASYIEANTQDRLQVYSVQPLQSAWDDVVGLSNGISGFWVKLVALRTNPSLIDRRQESDYSSAFTIAALPRYAPAEAQQSTQGAEFSLEGQCLVHLEHDNETDLTGSAGSVCFFPFEHNSSAQYNNIAPWKDPSIQHHFIRRTGPEGFRSFPNHHFFVRVYRPNAIMTSLLNRQPTFLSGNEWLTTPWENHPRAPIDRLLDILVLLPDILSRADRILPNDPTVPRRLQAQDLLSSCLNVEGLLQSWDSTPPISNSSTDFNTGLDLGMNFNPGLGTSPGSNYFTTPTLLPYWIEDNHSNITPPQIPFADPFAFRDGPYDGALAHVLLWAAQVLLRSTIAQLQRAIFAPLVDVYPPTQYPNLPPALQLSSAHYGGRAIGELASNVCRSLDAALRTGSQPDLLLGPLAIVEAFYRSCGDGDAFGSGDGNGDGSLELLWCEGFRARMSHRGQEIADQHIVRDGVSWVELAKY